MIDYNILMVLLASVLLGSAAGLIGSFTVLRRQAIAGDALAHAALPGLCLAYLVLGDRNLPLMMAGALATSLLAMAAINGLKRWTRVREDAAVCIVLGVFFGAGIVLARFVQNSPAVGSKAELGAFLLGQTAGVTAADVRWMGALAAACAAMVLLLYKEFKLTVFDARFARAQGWPVRWLDFLLMSLAAVAIVIGLSAIGVVMMAALLILPAASARFWTDRFGRLLAVSTALGMAISLAGTIIGMQFERLPPGPIVILTGAAVFVASLLLAPERGMLARALKQRQFQRDLATGQITLHINRGALPEDLTLPLNDGLQLPGDADLISTFDGDNSATAARNVGESPTRKSSISTVDSKSQLSALSADAIPQKSAFAALQTKLWVAVAVAGGAMLVAHWWNGLTEADQPDAAWTIALGCLANIPCAVLGCFLVLRRSSLLGDAISHSVLPGIAVGFLLSSQITGLPIVVSAVVVGVVTAFLIHALRDWGKVPEDSSLGIVYISLFAVGILMLAKFAAKSALDPSCFLYGLLELSPSNQIDIAGFEVPRVLPTLLATCFYTFLFVTLLWKELKVAFFDSALATAIGINARLVDFVLMGFVAAVAVAAFEALGSIMVVAMFIVPAATARLLTDRLASMLGWSMAVAVLSSIGGNIAALHFNTSAAGCMVLAAGLQFLAALFFAPQHGLIGKWIRGFSLSLRIAAEDIVAMLYRAEEAVARGEHETVVTNSDQANAVIRGMTGSWAISQLQSSGQVHVTDDGALALTDAGRQRAQSIVRSHRLWETFLGAQTDLPLDHLHAAAERMEHFIGPELQQKIAAQLPAVDVDPHGRAIPADHGWRLAAGAPSLPEVHRSVAVPKPLTVTVLPRRAKTPLRFEVPKSAGFWRMMLAFAGPGMMVSVGYMDPGNWATDLAGGSRFGYTLLSVVLISNFLAMLLQYLSLKLGIVSGRDLAQACRDHYSKPATIGLWLLCEVAIAACDLAEVIGSAIALNLLFGLPLLIGVLLTAGDVFVILFLQHKGFRMIEALVITLIFVIGGCFAYEIIASKPVWGDVAAGLIPQTKIVTDSEMLFLAVSILGA
ncbi:MAG TPA: Nramp family divalent metal transporter, partial [Pirellulales bacterium]